MKESFCVSPLLKRTLAVSSYVPAGSAAGSSKRNGMRSCSPVGRESFLLPATGCGRPSDHSQSHDTVSRELLMTMSCFSTVSPGRKMWSLLVKWPGLPPM